MTTRVSFIKRPVTAFVAMGLLTLFFLGAFFGCGRPGAYSTTYLDVFDTVLTVTVGSESRDEALEQTAAIHDIALDLHRLFDIYHTYDGLANLRTVNASAGGSPVAVDVDILNLLTMGKAIYLRSGGTVNIMMGAVTSLWHNARTAGNALPDPAALMAARDHSSIDSLVIDWETGTVAITDPAASLDVGAIAKGYVLERIRQYAKEAGLPSLLVNLGGQILALGNHPDGDPWQVQVHTPGGQDTTLSVTDGVVVTSADDQRTFTVDGVAYHHIIDPATGYPSTAHRSVTLLMPLSHTDKSDGYSTALFLLSDEAGEKLLADIPGAQIVAVSPAPEANT